MNTENKKLFHVRAFDTDYGFDTTWDFNTQEEAENWTSALLYDYGAACEAHWWKDEA